MGEREKITIYCPRCRRKVATWDGKATINVLSRCKTCRRNVIFHVDTMKTEIKRIPARATSSGVQL